MSLDQSANLPPLISRERGHDAVRDALRLFIGRGRRYSVKQVSNATGVKDRVIQCAMTASEDPECRPMHISDLLSIATFLGPEFTTEWLVLAQQAAVALPNSDEPDPGQLAADVADDTATVVRAARDAKFDRDERRDLKAVGARMIYNGGKLVQLRATG